MTDWHRFDLVRAERDRLQREVDDLNDELERLQRDYWNLELVVADLEEELADARARHPSTRRT